MKQRTRKIGIGFAIAVAAGCAYAVFVRYTGLAIPCMVHLITGLKCPGCGVTSMCLSILQLDFKAAYHSNQMLFVLLPVLSYLFGSYVLSYIRTGRWVMSKAQTLLTYICIGLLLLFTVYRNLYGI